MWRIKVLTETFGPCGFGWWYKITDKRLEAHGEEIKAFVDIELFYVVDGKVSQPVVGTGGASFCTMEKSGPYVSDECFKMALTDAISVAAKSLGVGADLYYDKDRDKYTSVYTSAPASEEAAAQTEELKTYNCSLCMKAITKAEAQYSWKNYKRILCRDCQKKV